MLIMNDGEENIAIKLLRILLCLGVGAVCFFAAFYSNLAYDTNDDPASMILLAKDGNFFSPLFAKPLSVLIASLYRISPLTPWWIYLTLMTISLSIAAVLYILSKRYKPITLPVVSIIVVYLFLVTTTEGINFTRTAAAASLAGIILILQGIEDFSQKRIEAVIQLVIGIVFWLWGAMIRDQIAYVVIPFAGVYLLFHILNRCEKLDMKKFAKEAKIPLMIAGGTLSVALLTLFVSGLFYTADEKDSLEYYKARISVQDYAQNYKNYEEAIEEYSSLGISENDYHLIFSDWTTEDPEFFTTELFLEMRERLYHENSLSQTIRISLDYLKNNSLNLIAIAIAVVFLILSKRRKVEIITYFAVAMLYLLYLAFLGRIAERVVEPAILYAVVFIVFTSDFKISRGSLLVVVKSVAIVVFTAGLFFIDMMPKVKGWVNNLPKEITANHSIGTYTQNADDFYNMIAENKEDVYFLPLINSLELLPSERISPKFQPDTERIENLFFLGGWDARVPVNYQAMAEYGIENPMQSLFKNKNALCGYDEELDIYMREHYGSEISVSLAKYIEQFSGVKYGFYQYSMPIEGVITNGDKADSIYIEDLRYIDNSDDMYTAPNGGSLYISGAQGGYNATIYDELFLNVDVDSERLSYRLYQKNDGSFECRAFGLTKDEIEIAEISLVAKTTEGEYINIVDLSDSI